LAKVYLSRLIDCKVGKKVANPRLCHFSGMAFLLKEHEPLDPLSLGSLGFETQVHKASDNEA